jgi:hypothetical protein
MTPGLEETIRPELTAMPIRIAALPRFRGYPVPWFVAYPNGPEGDPEFRVADGAKWMRAVKERICWVCGRHLGSWLAFVLGPMCGITRTTSEPACHRECAEWSMRNCPFLTRPQAVRRTVNLPAGTVDPPGHPLDRNPGVTLLWMTRDYTLFHAADDEFRLLIRVGDPVEVRCLMEGRRATRKEVDESIAGGLPKLMALAEEEGAEAVAELERQVAEFETWLLPERPNV